ncbi:MAG: tetratricopeptide repeat protein [Deltaproteobacteria bacterium]|nr:tetratricopeptide repeat protein [Deltaproteobacteria bacterium]
MRSQPTVAILVAACLALWAESARAGTDDEAKALFRSGVALFKDGDYRASAEAFEKAYALKPTYKLLYNIGQARAAAHEYDLAISAFERYLVDGGDELDSARRDEVLAEIAKMRPLVGFLEIRGPDGLTLLVDGRERGRTPLQGKLMLTVGKAHRVEVRDGGKPLIIKDVQVYGGTIEVVEAAREAGPEPESAPFAQPAKEPTSPPTKAPEPAVNDTLWVAGWITLGTGAAALVAGGVLGGLALSQSGTLDEVCPGGGCSPNREAEVKALDSMALGADILLGVGAAAAAAGVVMLLWPAKEGESAAAVVPMPGGAAAMVAF